MIKPYNSHIFWVFRIRLNDNKISKDGTHKYISNFIYDDFVFSLILILCGVHTKLLYALVIVLIQFTDLLLNMNIGSSSISVVLFCLTLLIILFNFRSVTYLLTKTSQLITIFWIVSDEKSTKMQRNPPPGFAGFSPNRNTHFSQRQSPGGSRSPTQGNNFNGGHGQNQNRGGGFYQQRGDRPGFHGSQVRNCDISNRVKKIFDIIRNNIFSLFDSNFYHI